MSAVLYTLFGSSHNEVELKYFVVLYSKSVKDSDKSCYNFRSTRYYFPLQLSLAEQPKANYFVSNNFKLLHLLTCPPITGQVVVCICQLLLTVPHSPCLQRPAEGPPWSRPGSGSPRGGPSRRTRTGWWCSSGSSQQGRTAGH